jgi:hypothetical protein
MLLIHLRIKCGVLNKIKLGFSHLETKKPLKRILNIPIPPVAIPHTKKSTDQRLIFGTLASQSPIKKETQKTKKQFKIQSKKSQLTNSHPIKSD